MKTRVILAVMVIAFAHSTLQGQYVEPCKFTGDREQDAACQELRNQKAELIRQQQEMERQREEMQRQQEELEQMQSDMRQIKVQQQIQQMESDPSFQETEKQNPACALAMRRLQTAEIQYEEDRRANSGKAGFVIDTANWTKKIQKRERQVYKSCNIPDPNCEEQKAKLAELPLDASDRKKQKAKKKVNKACRYLETE